MTQGGVRGPYFDFTLFMPWKFLSEISGAFCLSRFVLPVSPFSAGNHGVFSVFSVMGDE